MRRLLAILFLVGAASAAWADVASYGGVPASPVGTGVKVADGGLQKDAIKSDAQGRYILPIQDADARTQLENIVLRQEEGMGAETSGTAYAPPIEIR